MRSENVIISGKNVTNGPRNCCLAPTEQCRRVRGGYVKYVVAALKMLHHSLQIIQQHIIIWPIVTPFTATPPRGGYYPFNTKIHSLFEEWQVSDVEGNIVNNSRGDIIEPPPRIRVTNNISGGRCRFKDIVPDRGLVTGWSSLIVWVVTMMVSMKMVMAPPLPPRKWWWW